jgi:hypothetical protein
MALFPVPFLHLAIRADGALLGPLTEYVRQSLAYAELLQQAAPVNPLLAPQAWLRAFLPNLAPRGDAGPGPAAVLDAIAGRLADLEQRLDQLRAAGGEPAPPPDKGKQGKERGKR